MCLNLLTRLVKARSSSFNEQKIVLVFFLFCFIPDEMMIDFSRFIQTHTHTHTKKHIIHYVNISNTTNRVFFPKFTEKIKTSNKSNKNKNKIDTRAFECKRIITEVKIKHYNCKKKIKE